MRGQPAGTGSETAAASPPVIAVRGLVKTYGDHHAVAGTPER